MLSINPKNRPTISTILEKPFMRKKVAAYISDFIQNNNTSEDELFQCEILKEQAEKLGVFNYIAKELSIITDNDTNINSTSLNSISYLNKTKEEKRIIEEKIAELEKQKRILYSNLQVRIGRKAVNRGNNLHENSNSVEKKVKRSLHVDNLEYSKLRPNKRSMEKVKRPESNKRAYRKISNDSEDGSIGTSKDFGNEKNKKRKSLRPNSGAIHVIRSKLEDVTSIPDDLLLETIKEENDDIDVKIEKNKIIKLTQEITRMKEHLNVTQCKIDKIECNLMKKKNSFKANLENNSHDSNGNPESETKDEAVEDERSVQIKERIKFFRQ